MQALNRRKRSSRKEKGYHHIRFYTVTASDKFSHIFLIFFYGKFPVNFLYRKQFPKNSLILVAYVAITVRLRLVTYLHLHVYLTFVRQYVTVSDETVAYCRT